jgi:hypothetical protein
MDILHADRDTRGGFFPPQSTGFNAIIENLKFSRIHKGPFRPAEVIAPDHLHLVLSNEKETTLSDTMRDFRQFTSRSIQTLIESDGRRAFPNLFRVAAGDRPHQEFKVWSDDFHPIALKGDKRVKRKIG